MFVHSFCWTFSAFAISVVNAAIISQPPVNTAVRVGQQAYFKCTLRTSPVPEQHHTTWSREIGDTQENIWKSNAPVPLPGYSVNNADSKYDMTVLTPAVTGNWATRHTCYLLCSTTDCGATGEEKHSALLIVLEQPVCTSSVQTAQVGQLVQFSCEFQYQGGMQPTVRWRWMMGELEPNVELTVGTGGAANKLKVISNITASGDHDMKTFYCEVTFVSTPTEAAPQYYDSCMKTIQVTHSPSVPVIYPSPDSFKDEIVSVQVNEVINCSSSANPSAAYTWWELTALGSDQEKELLPPRRVTSRTSCSSLLSCTIRSQTCCGTSGVRRPTACRVC